MTFPDRWRTLGKRWISRRRAEKDLRVLSGVELRSDGPVVFAIVRNEILRLPRFLAHYRALGASGFVIVDNHSTDGTRDLLHRQGDVFLYGTESHFRGKEAWLDCLFRRHGRNRWCVVADADELLVYADSPCVKLPDLCRYLEETGCNALHAILLDFYPAGPVSEVSYGSGQDYFRMEWFFDPFPSLQKAPRHFFRGHGLDYRFEGGSRKRVFGVSACCSKFPLFRFTPGMFLTDGQHYLEAGRFSELRAVLCHFKYLQDFALHVREEVVRGQHWGGAVEYRAYAETLDGAEGGVRFRNQNSLRFSGVSHLEESGFLTRPESYQKFVSRLPAAS
jgi:hypothetical protein